MLVFMTSHKKVNVKKTEYRSSCYKYNKVDNGSNSSASLLLFLKTFTYDLYKKETNLEQINISLDTN